VVACRRWQDPVNSKYPRTGAFVRQNIAVFDNEFVIEHDERSERLPTTV
jgi:hypothetical protein